MSFHRAFDLVRDRHEALDTLASAGVTRVLTSGGSRTALLGADEIGSLVKAAGPRLIVVAGGGIREENVQRSCDEAACERFTSAERRCAIRRCRRRTMRYLRKLLPDDEGTWEETDEARVRAFVARASEAAR